MSLTDGVIDFQAMEYQPIPQLSAELTPGTKVGMPAFNISAIPSFLPSTW